VKVAEVTLVVIVLAPKGAAFRQAGLSRHDSTVCMNFAFLFVWTVVLLLHARVWYLGRKGLT